MVCAFPKLFSGQRLLNIVFLSHSPSLSNSEFLIDVLPPRMFFKNFELLLTDCHAPLYRTMTLAMIVMHLV